MNLIFYHNNFRILLAVAVLILLTGSCIIAQIPESTNDARIDFVKGQEKDVYSISKRFIENIGQYGDIFPQQPAMGTIRYGYEGLDMPVLFTEKGLIHLQRKIKGPTMEEREREEKKRKKKSKEMDFEMQKIIDKSITMEWVNANTHPQIIAEEMAEGYHTYGMMSGKARAFKKITYKELYQGIDLIYTFNEGAEAGFEYRLVVRPGANTGIVKIRFGGDVKRVKLDESGNLNIKSAINGIFESRPVTFLWRRTP